MSESPERPGFEVGKEEVDPKELSKNAGTGSPPKSSTGSPFKLPSYTSMSDSPSVAAGVPVLELVRKFEDERILSREDRVALNEALYNPDRREGVVKALKDVELGSNSRFAIRRLKAQIHQNGTGEVTSKMIKRQKGKGVDMASLMSPLVEAQLSARGNKDKGAPMHSPRTQAAIEEHKHKKEVQRQNEIKASDRSRAPQSEASGSPSRRAKSKGSKAGNTDAGSSVPDSISVTQQAIEKVVGNAPMYVPIDHFNVCQKIIGRLRDFLVKYKPSAIGVRKFAVLVGSGSFNPLTRMHLRSYFVAKQYLEAKCGYIVLGSLLSPAHGISVRERYRTNQSEILPSTHRLAIAQLLVQSSKWLCIDPWEMTRRRPMDYLSLLQHVDEVLKTQFPDINIKVLYLAKANAVPKISPVELKKGNFGVVSVCRATEFDMILKSLGAKWNGLIQCVEDTAVLDASMDVVTSRKVRKNMRKEKSIEALAGTAIDAYVRDHGLGKKMNGTEEYTEEEKIMPEIPSRPMRVYLRSQLLSMTSGSIGNTPGSMGYTPSWSSPQNNSVHAGSALQKQRIHSSIPEVPGSGSPLVDTEGPASRANRSPSPVRTDGNSSPSLLAKKSPDSNASSVDSFKQVTSISSLTIETTNL